MGEKVVYWPDKTDLGIGVGVPIGDPALTVKIEEELGLDRAGGKEIEVDDKVVGKSW